MQKIPKTSEKIFRNENKTQENVKPGIATNEIYLDIKSLKAALFMHQYNAQLKPITTAASAQAGPTETRWF